MANEKMVTDSVAKNGTFPYPFRTAWFVFLLAINLLVAAYYFHIVQ
jgi:photosystem I protein